jgi:hypothetical protein
MAHRIVVGLLMAATLSGCFDGGNGLSGSSSSGASAGIASSGNSTVAAVQLIMQGVPASGATVGVAYSFAPTMAASSGVVSFAIEGQPAWASFDSSTGVLSGTPSLSDVGLTGDITIIASNGSNSGSIGPFTIRVSPVSSASEGAPLISGTPSAMANAGQAYSFQPQASDAAGRPLTYAIANCPMWAMFSTATGQLSGTPSSAQVGNYTHIDISVSDGTTSVALPVFSIAVTAGAQGAPAISGTPLSTVVAGQSYSFQPSATDPAAQTLTFSIANAPSWVHFDTATGQLSGTPSPAQEGTYADIIISVSDGTSSASLNAFTITVTAPGGADAPTISGSPPSTAIAGQDYSFQPTASSPTGLPLQFSIINRPLWASFDAATGKLSGTPSAAQEGSPPPPPPSVSDGSSSATLAAFGIVVAPGVGVGGELTIAGSPATSVIFGNEYSFTPTSTDPSGGKLSFSIKNAPSWASFNSATGELSGLPTAADVGTYSNIIISLSDGTTSVSLPAFTITVTENATGSVTLQWTAPTENTNGTPLTNLAGYWIYYGTSANALTKSVQITNPGIVSYVLQNLSPGTWYFALSSYTNAGVQSSTSPVASTTVH